ncbi:hypothetical protein Dsin_011574 [Dipteronia sinensis]|uniref:RNase H type-1 domain-containing protein n=1 Tax=Dipteronia sinensis TaxID=43782 RepID=A0AAE0AVX5_9ROSI|nr:hypothetical protein Dsin_011574 [Dipteronia sinensis]
MREAACSSGREELVRNRCPLCMREIETTWHALWGCRLLKDIRVSLPSIQDGMVGNMGKFLDFLLICFEQLSREDMVLLCMVMWRIWSLRNSKVHGASIGEVVDLVSWARTYLSDFQGSDVPLMEERTQKKSDGGVVWRPLNMGVYKLNCDADVDQARGFIGIGLVAEAVAIYRGLRLAIESGLRPIMVESDAALVVKWINVGSFLDSNVGLILSDIRSLIHEAICVEIGYTYRNYDKVAHVLVKNVLLCEEDRYWLEECPPFARPFIHADFPC